MSENLEKQSDEPSKPKDMKISKKVRDDLRLLKIVLSQSSYDDVISFLISFYKKNKLHAK